MEPGSGTDKIAGRVSRFFMTGEYAAVSALCSSRTGGRARDFPADCPHLTLSTVRSGTQDADSGGTAGVGRVSRPGFAPDRALRRAEALRHRHARLKPGSTRGAEKERLSRRVLPTAR